MSANNILEHLDVVMLSVDETVDDGIILEVDSKTIVNRVLMQGADGSAKDITDMTISQAMEVAREQLLKVVGDDDGCSAVVGDADGVVEPEISTTRGKSGSKSSPSAVISTNPGVTSFRADPVALMEKCGETFSPISSWKSEHVSRCSSSILSSSFWSFVVRYVYGSFFQ